MIVAKKQFTLSNPCLNRIGDINLFQDQIIINFDTNPTNLEIIMSANNVLKTIKDKEIEYVDLRFTDPRGKLQHVTMDAKVVDGDMLEEGIFFDGSSIAGWKAINESDMILKPDLSRAIVDPFTSHNTLNIFCDILDAIKKDPYERDPRGTAKKAEAYLKKSGIGDKAFFGPEAEFFVFDDVKFKNDMNETGFKIMSDSLIAFQPAIDEPSKKTPSFNIPSSTIEASIVKC